jgi:7,8-dihydropterin-6-yl-methyl-4-(beta-D-ribofuranosyl)aminobenzene 5'-phosphate synthase
MKRCYATIVLALFLAPVAFGQAPSQAPSPGPVLVPVLPGVDVTVLVENMAGDPSLLGEWGLSFLIETGKHRILFDAGGGRTLFENARALKVDLTKLDAIVVSHGHFDHTGGLEKALETSGPVDLFIHPAAFAPRYFKGRERVLREENGISRDELRGKARGLLETSAPTPVREGVMVTGQVPRTTDFEDTGVGGFIYLDADMKTPDLVPDDQAIFFRVPEGVVVILGCAHAGVVNTARYVMQLTGAEKIYAVMGGTHLLSASPQRMQATIEAFRQMGIERILLGHCTGVNSYAQLAGAFPGRCAWPPTGAKIHFGGN